MADIPKEIPRPPKPELKNQTKPSDPEISGLDRAQKQEASAIIDRNGNPREKLKDIADGRPNIEAFINTAKITGLRDGAPKKILELIARRSKIKQEQYGKKRQFPPGFEKDTEHELGSSLAQFNIDYEDLVRLASTFKLPNMHSIMVNSQIPQRELAEFALVSRTVPVQAERPYGPIKREDLKYGGGNRLTFDRSGLTYDAEKILWATQTAQTVNGKDLLFYPHTNEDGVIESTTVFEVSRYQRYLFERKAREILANKLVTDIYPETKARSKKERNLTVRQRSDKHVIFKDEKSGEVVFEADDGVLDYPLGSSQRVNIVYSNSLQSYGAYNAAYDSFLIGPEFLSDFTKKESGADLSPREKVMLVARHEFNHSFWADLSPQDKKVVMDMIDPKDPHVKFFISRFLSRGKYAERAMRDLQRDPHTESIPVEHNGQLIRISKERVVNELLAFATWDEVLGNGLDSSVRQKMLSMSTPENPEAGTGQLAAFDAFNSLSPQSKEFIKSKKLKMDAGSAEFQEFFESFKTAIAILNSG